MVKPKGRFGVVDTNHPRKKPLLEIHFCSKRTKFKHKLNRSLQTQESQEKYFSRMSDMEQTNKEQTNDETQEFLFFVKAAQSLSHNTPKEERMLAAIKMLNERLEKYPCHNQQTINRK